jgi:gamma-glutamyltranspeptidase/glutathione hydrolase
MPEAAGLGGDLLALVGEPTGAVHAVNGTGLSPRGLDGPPPTTGGGSVTVPGLVDGWLTLHRRWGRLRLAAVLEPARRLAADGVAVEDPLADAVRRQHDRLLAGGAGAWELLDAVATPGATWRQPALAELLAALAERGRAAFYGGRAAHAIAGAASRCGGVLHEADLHGHRTVCPPPVSVRWDSGHVAVQPPHSQGVLLALALQEVERLGAAGVEVTDHVLVEATQAAFVHRSSCARGASLLEERLEVDLDRASGRRGPRAYLHTAGVAAVDADGLVVSSLVSVFDDFGSGVFVPELGFVLNNRAAGFTDGANAWAPGKRPVHTLAPALVRQADGSATALATPGADGQVQTLLQVLAARRAGCALADAVAALRWRSQDGDLLVEEGHPATADLTARGHRTRPRTPGDELFGAVVAAGTGGVAAPAADPWALADWRRRTSSGAVA